MFNQTSHGAAATDAELSTHPRVGLPRGALVEVHTLEMRYVLCERTLVAVRVTGSSDAGCDQGQRKQQQHRF